MAEISGFFNSFEGDRQYYVSFLAEYFANFVGNGIFFGGNYLKVEPFGGNMDIQVLEGRGFINGYYYANKDAAKVITLEPAHLTLPRIDRVVLRLDLREEKRAVTAEIVKGTPANSPVATALRRDHAVYELSIATIRVNASVTEIRASNITDTRLGADCGVVMHLVPNGFSLDTIFNQYSASLNDRIAEWETKKTQQASSWQSQMNTQQTTFNQKTDEIDEWYADIRANITKLQTFDFDNLFGYPGCKRITAKDGESFRETIITSANSKKVAERVTTRTTSAISEAVKVYEQDGVTIMKTFVILTTKSAAGIEERVVG